MTTRLKGDVFVIFPNPRGNGVSRIMEATLAKTVLLYGERRILSAIG